MIRYALPLGIFVVLVTFLGVGLKLDPREVPSPLVGKPAPDFVLPRLHDLDREIALRDMQGKVWLLNVWASWCVACRQEHPLMVELARSGEVEIVGLNYKDEVDVALQWLARYGDPYTVSAFDQEGRVGIDWGVYGVPETFVIDPQGVVRYKHIGPVDPEVLNQTILPLVRELRGEQA